LSRLVALPRSPAAQGSTWAPAFAGEVESVLFYDAFEHRPNPSETLETLLDGWVFRALKAHIFTLPAPGAKLDFHQQLGRPAVGLSAPPSGR